MHDSLRPAAWWLARRAAVSGAALCLALASGAALRVPLRAAETRIGAHTFTLPDGFEIECVAAPPLVERPISAAFDEQGRLYVTDSSGSNDKVEKQLAEKPHRVVRLEDSDGDGRFDRSTVFADKMMLPQGAMWLDGSLYVGAPPSIWKLTDTDGDGIADRREEWFKGKTLTGCANDLHGPFLGPEGWIYWTKGAFAEQTHEREGKPPITDRAAHIFRCRPDGTGLESVMSGGMDNPVEVAFTRTGEPIFTATFIDLSGEGKRDGLGHAVWGGVFGKENEVTEGVPRTGPRLLPAMTHFGPGAPSGLCRYEAAVFGDEYRDNFFATLFNLRKVMRHVLEPAGATFKTRDSDFVVSDNADFHPTDVLEDADGSLLIVDTGGWYKLCCPTSQLAKPDVLGAIYRVWKKGAKLLPPDRPGSPIELSAPDARSLVGGLDDPRPAFVRQVMSRLIRAGREEQRALQAGSKIEVRQELTWQVANMLAHTNSPAAGVNALWVLAQIDAPEWKAGGSLDNRYYRFDAVRETAARIAGMQRDAGAVTKLINVLLLDSAASPHLRRSAAEALGRIGNPDAVPALLQAMTTAQDDPFLAHAITFALIETDAWQPIEDGLKHPSVAVQRAALIALSQVPTGTAGVIQPEQVAPFFRSPHPELREAAAWVLGRHPELGGALIDFFRERLAGRELSSQERGELEAVLARAARDPAIQELLASTVREPASMKSRLAALHAMARAEVKPAPPAWVKEVTHLLGRGRDLVGEGAPECLRAAIATARNFLSQKDSAPSLIPALLSVAREPALPAEVRIDALASLPTEAVPADLELFAFLRMQLNAAQPAHRRSAAAGVLARMQLGEAEQFVLADALRTLGPVELGKLLPVFSNAAPSEELGRRLLAALREAPTIASLPPQTLRAALAKMPAPLQPECEQLLAGLNLDLSAQRVRLETIAAELPAGDVRRGQLVFNSQKAMCATCHAMGYLGGKFGPDLTSIGQARSERDLLESIVFPSASFVRSYEPVAVRTARGEELLGFLKGESGEAITLATTPGAEARIARGDIAGQQPGTVSLMPQGYDQILTRQELADLVAFLKATRWGAQ